MIDFLSTPHKVLFWLCVFRISVNLLVVLFATNGQEAKSVEVRGASSLASVFGGFLSMALLLWGAQ